jgi:thiamine biosynthesis protein ThiS
LTLIHIKLNGQDRDLDGPTTVADLVESLGLKPRFVAVERNRMLVPRGKHADTLLEEGDEIEVVTLVGGG